MSEKTTAPTKVFISYSWDSEEHKEQVLSLANTLRNPWGIETDIDQYVRAKPPFTPPQGWDLWMEKRIEWAEFVLIVCTETYKRRFRGDEEPGIGRGVTWEGTIIRQHLYNDQLVNTKFIPVVFSSPDLTHVPMILNGNDKYALEGEKSFRELCYRLRKQPTVIMPEVLTARLPAPPEPKFFSSKKPQAEPPPVLLDVTVTANELISDRGVDYSRLRDFLKARQWQEADQEMADRMCEAMGRRQEGWLRVEDIQNFPCADLRTIDQLWVKYSNGKFGFSVQKQIWQDCGSPTEWNASWNNFGDRVGWRTSKTIMRERGILWTKRQEEKEREEWLSFANQLTFSLDAPAGHLPRTVCEELWVRFRGVGAEQVWVILEGYQALFSTVNTCKL